MKMHQKHRSIFNFILLTIISLPVHSSDFEYSGSQLKFDYSGPMIVDNSQLTYTASDRLTFYTEDYLTKHTPKLLPLRAAIDTWAAMHSIHPRILSEVLNQYFSQDIIEDSYENKNRVFQIAAGISQGFNENKTDNLAATKAVAAIAQSYHFELNLNHELSLTRDTSTHEYFRGNAGPPLFDYFQPPWPRGELWAGGGVHTNTGSGTTPRNSLDFFKNFVGWGDGNTKGILVTASQSGIVRVFSECSINVIHPNGWISSYYHLENIEVTDMSNVTSNQVLSSYADDLATATCQGGHSTGPHLHFSVYYNGTAIEIDEPNVDFTSWKHNAGKGNYDSTCARSYYTVTPSNTTVCPFSRQLPNDTSANYIFGNGFE